jgi:hypothetical protein
MLQDPNVTVMAREFRRLLRPKPHLRAVPNTNTNETAA